jgi:hypothetical protein
MDGEKEGSGAKLTEWQNEDEGDSESMAMRRSGRRLRRPCFGCDHVNPRGRKLEWGKKNGGGIALPFKGQARGVEALPRCGDVGAGGLVRGLTGDLSGEDGWR